MAALEQLYRRYYRLVRWVLRGSGVAESALDDRVHDVFLAIHRRLPQRALDVPLRQWVTGVARNVAFSHRRTLARQRRQLEQLATAGDRVEQPDEQVARQQAWRALHGFLEQLSPEQREVFVMVDITGMRVSELAATTGEPANTLHSRLRVARVRFGRHFDASDDQRGPMLRRAERQARVGEQHRRRTWAAIATALPPEALAGPSAATIGSASKTVSGWLSTTAGKVALTAAAAGALTVAAVAGPTPNAEPSKSPTTAAASPGPTSTYAEAHDTARVVPRESEPTTPSIVATSTHPIEPAAARHQPAARATASPRLDDPASPGTKAAATPSDTTTPSDTAGSPRPSAAPSADSLEPDAAMASALLTLRRARQHLSQSRAAAAIAELDGFEGTFGDLEREHLRLRLEASCTLGDSARARTTAEALAASGVAIDPDAPCTDLPD